jgi:hypothetical protein
MGNRENLDSVGETDCWDFDVLTSTGILVLRCAGGNVVSTFRREGDTVEEAESGDSASDERRVYSVEAGVAPGASTSLSGSRGLLDTLIDRPST